MKPRPKLFDSAIPLFNLLERAGISYEQLYERVHQQQTGTQEDRTVSINMNHLLEAAVDLTGDTALALRLGQNTEAADWGTFGFALMSCSTLKKAMQLSQRYLAIVGPGPGWEVCEHPRGAAFRLKLAPSTPLQQQLTTELNMSLHHSVAAFLLKEMDQGAEVHLNYPAPAHSAEYQSVFPGTVLFDQPHSQFVIDEQALNKQVRTANPAAHVVFLQQCEEMLQGLSKVEDTTAAVRRLLIQDAGDFPDIGQVADKLQQSERTLSRRLNAESTSFRAVCDEVRNVLAKQYLSNTELTVAEVAHLLGYTETVNFRRAFVRWNGVTPREFSNRSLN